MPKLINGKYVIINILATPEIKKQIENAAEERGVSVGAFLKMIAMDKIKEDKKLHQ